MGTRKLAAEPRADEEEESENQDDEADGERDVAITVSVIDGVVAESIPAKERDDGQKATGEEGEKARGE